MRTQKEKTFWNTAAFLLRTLLTGVVVFILLVQANGYEINFHRLTLTKIGLLFIHPNPLDASASLSFGKLSKQGQNLVAALTPGQYVVMLTKPNYRPWSATVSIQAGRSNAFPFATLYLAEPTLLEQRSASAQELTSPLVDPTLTAEQGELWHRTRDGQGLVTRYFPSIRSARLFDAGHALVQLGAEIHIIDLDGSNDQVLLTLGDDRQRRFLPLDSKTIGLLDIDQVTIYRIR